MNVYMHAANDRRPPLGLVKKFAIMAILGALAGWAVRSNMASRTTAHGEAGVGCSVMNGGTGAGIPAFSPANDGSDYFRFDPGNPGLNLASVIRALLQSSAPVLLKDGGLEFPELPDSFPGDAAGGGFHAGIMFWIAPGHPPLTRTASLDITDSGDENSGGALFQGARTGINARKGARMSSSTTTPSYEAYIDSNGLAALTSHGANNQAPLPTTSYDTATGFPASTSSIKVHLIPEPSPATLAAAGFLVLLFRLYTR